MTGRGCALLLGAGAAANRQRLEVSVFFIRRVKQVGFGARLGYSVTVNVEQRPVRTSALPPVTAQ